MQISTIFNSIKNELKSIYPDSEINAIAQSIQYYITDFKLDDAAIQNIVAHCIQDLKAHKPLQYILGVAYFWNRYFNVNASTLIPRPETEELILWIRDNNESSLKKPMRIIDIGTGTGCIPIILQSFFANAKIYGMDINEEALNVAQSNDTNKQVHWLMDSILNPTKENVYQDQFDIIVSNPPYITLAEMESMEKNVLAYEPNIALFVTNGDPLQFYRCILDFSNQYLKPNGSVYLELNYLFAQETAALFETSGYQTTIKKDMQGKDRMLHAVK